MLTVLVNPTSSPTLDLKESYPDIFAQPNASLLVVMLSGDPFTIIIPLLSLIKGSFKLIVQGPGSTFRVKNPFGQAYFGSDTTVSLESLALMQNVDEWLLQTSSPSYDIIALDIS